MQIPIQIPFKKEIEEHTRLTGHKRYQILGLSKKGKRRTKNSPIGLHCKDCEEVNK